ncbi:hypothetical protein RJ639_040998 [Escallonia herrerae]|uniref:Reverse transcriptase/retrotransposon-derived protein RNase H-like domain-containing protein n=1 Tax=Escallonia herrerae TaxID=1293975 RepID=A0AA89B3F1_9ASTE|nr:hypothetical protein RJ639_040998 [Escallonia herrerae]
MNGVNPVQNRNAEARLERGLLKRVHHVGPVGRQSPLERPAATATEDTAYAEEVDGRRSGGDASLDLRHLAELFLKSHARKEVLDSCLDGLVRAFVDATHGFQKMRLNCIERWNSGFASMAREMARNVFPATATEERTNLEVATTTVAQTTTVAIPTIPAVISPFVAAISAPETVVPPAVTITPPSESTALPPFQTFGTFEPFTTGVIHTTPPVVNNEADLMAVMQQSIEQLQAVVNKPLPKPEPRVSKTPELTNQHVTPGEDGSPMMKDVTQGLGGKKKALIKLILAKTLIIILVNIMLNDIPVPRSSLGDHSLRDQKPKHLKWPKPMRMPTDKRDAQLYCHFHKDHGHTTEECKVLQREIENVIAKGHLKQIVKANEHQGGRQGRSQRRHEESGPVKLPRIPNTISFDDTDLKEIITLHDDALVISLQIDAFVIKLILVDTGASAPVEGVIPLTVVARKHPIQATQSIDFLVVKVKSAYNGILGRAGLNKLQIVPSTFHLCMKFPTPNAIGMVKGDQAVARKCYMASCRVEEALAIEDQRDEHTFRRAEPVEELALKNIKNFEWTAECQASFEALKSYLSAPLLLSKPLVGEELFLYLAITDSAVSAVLVREQDSKQLPIYYVSKVLQGAKLRYPDTEKLVFSLLVTARKLRPYFQSHSITVLTDKPLRRILHKPDVSGRLVPWSIELGEFDIRYRPCPSIKGQALADFIVECTLPLKTRNSCPRKSDLLRRPSMLMVLPMQAGVELA